MKVGFSRIHQEPSSQISEIRLKPDVELTLDPLAEASGNLS